MFTSFVFWAMMGYCGDRQVPYIPFPGAPPPPPPDPFRVLRTGILVLGGIAGGYLSQTFLDPSIAASGLSAYATARLVDGLSRVLLSPHPLPPKEGRVVGR